MRRGLGAGLAVCVPLALLVACSADDSATEPSTTGATVMNSSGTPASVPSSPPTTAGSAATSSTPSGPRTGWVDDEVSFSADGLTVHGTFRHPKAISSAIPAALLIAGSGPTDRNGNSRMVPGSMNTLANLADVLAADDVATLRYDKVGSGRTGLGRFAKDLNTIGVGDFAQQAQAALRFLSSRPGVDRARLSVYGHSEGALFALLLATESADTVPTVHALGLLEPLSRRYLDIIRAQVLAQAAQQRSSGQITPAQQDEVTKLLRQAVTQLREKGTVPTDMPYGLNTLFTPSSLKFLREADAIDPARLGAALPRMMPVLLTCSDADIQVSCADVHHLAAAITSTGLELVQLTGVDHVLKQDASRTAQNYGKDLPFSSQLIAKLRQFATE